MSPLLADHITPTGATIHVTASPAAQLDRIAALRAEALETPIGAEWDEMDRATYLRYLDQTEAKLKGQASQ